MNPIVTGLSKYSPVRPSRSLTFPSRESGTPFQIGYSVSEQRPAASVSDHCGSFAGTGAAHNRNFAADHANYIGSFTGCDRTTQHGAPGTGKPVLLLLPYL